MVRPSRDTEQYIVELDLRSLDKTALAHKLEEALTERDRCVAARDEYNSKVRKHLDARNDINAKVKELIAQVAAIRGKRLEASSRINELKKNRSILDTKLKETRTAHRKNQDCDDVSSDLRGLRELEKKQDEAHNLLLLAVEEQVIAHEAMTELSDEVSQLREAGTREHKLAGENKVVADEFHVRHIRNMSITNACRDLIREIDESKEIAKLMQRIEALGIEKIAEAIRLFYSEDLAPEHQPMLDETVVFAEISQIKNKKKAHRLTQRVVIYLVCRERGEFTGKLIGKRGSRIRALNDEMATLLESNHNILSVVLMDDVVRERQHLEKDFSKFLISLN